MAYTGAHRKGHRWRGSWVLGLLLALPLAVLAIGVQPATAANVVNYTFHVPASVQTNPCYPVDVVNLSGDIHVVITTTTDGKGGYHVTNKLNSQLSGVSITTGTKYVNSEEKEDEWYARSPFPAIHTHTYDFLLVSQSNTANYVLHMTMHETVNAQGVPTATVDSFSMDCQG
jgi:NMD protein affecting ribosome stability and mRNA decay